MVPCTLRGCALSPSSHSFSSFPFQLQRKPRRSAASARAPRAWAARLSPSQTTRAPCIGTPPASRPARPSIPDLRRERLDTLRRSGSAGSRSQLLPDRASRLVYTTVSAPPDRQNGGSGEVHIGTFTTSNFGATVVQTIVPAVVIGTTVRVVSGGIDGDGLRDDRGFRCWGHGVGVEHAVRRDGKESEGTRVRDGRGSCPNGAAGPGRRRARAHGRCRPGCMGRFRSRCDADLTRRPARSASCARAAAGGEYWLLKGLVGVRGGIRWSTLGDVGHGVLRGFHGQVAEARCTSTVN